MAKLTRITQKQFGGNVPSATNNQITAFGSIKAGTPSYTLDPAAMQTSAYELGWSDAVVTGYTPYREDFNALEFINSYQLRYIFEAGIPEWDSGTTYFKGSYVKVINSSGVPTRYYSLTDSNLNNNPTTDTINWTEDSAGYTLADLADVAISGASGGQALVYNSTTQKWENSGGGSGLEIGDIGFAPLGIDETQNKRRYLNGQVISQAQFQSFTTKVKSAVALFPSLATTEVNWQAEVTNSKLGQCGKFVVDDVNGTIRLPKVVNINGLTNLSLMGSIKAESLPNTEFTVNYHYQETEPLAGTGLSGSAELTDIRNTTTGNLDSIRRNAILHYSASLGSSAYQDGATVQQEAIQYPYFIQVATGVEETLPAIREYEINTPFFFGQSMWTDVDPYNASWLLSNGQYNASTLYPDLWTQLTGVELNGSLNVGDTIEISGKTYIKRGLSVVLSTDPITGYEFVVNTVDSTFRLPLETDLGTTPAGCNLYYYVGDTVQDASLINAGRVLSGVADLRGNVVNKNSVSDRELVVGWGMPDYSAGVSSSSGVAQVNSWYKIACSNYNNAIVSLGGQNFTNVNAYETNLLFPVPKGVSYSSSNGGILYPFLG